MVTYITPFNLLLVILLFVFSIAVYCLYKWHQWEKAYFLVVKQMRQMDTEVKATQFAPLYLAPLNSSEGIRWSNRWGWVPK